MRGADHRGPAPPAVLHTSQPSVGARWGVGAGGHRFWAAAII